MADPFVSSKAVAPLGYRSPKRQYFSDSRTIGAQRNQNNEVGPGAPVAPPNNGSLGAGHDWTAFEDFSRVNRARRQPWEGAAPAPVSGSTQAALDPVEVFAKPAALAMRGASAATAFMPGVSAALDGAAAAFARPASPATSSPKEPALAPRRVTPDGRHEMLITDTAGNQRYVGYTPTAAESEAAQFGPNFASMPPAERAFMYRRRPAPVERGTVVASPTQNYAGVAGLSGTGTVAGQPNNQTLNGDPRVLGGSNIQRPDGTVVGRTIGGGIYGPGGSSTFSAEDLARNKAATDVWQRQVANRNPGGPTPGTPAAPVAPKMVASPDPANPFDIGLARRAAMGMATGGLSGVSTAPVARNLGAAVTGAAKTAQGAGARVTQNPAVATSPAYQAGANLLPGALTGTMKAAGALGEKVFEPAMDFTEGVLGIKRPKSTPKEDKETGEINAMFPSDYVAY